MGHEIKLYLPTFIIKTKLRTTESEEEVGNKNILLQKA